jgi:hypothetical protein
MATNTDVEVRDLLNAQTGRLAWAELQRHFSRGVVIRVAGGLDLVDAAARIVEDDRAVIERWLAQGLLSRATLEDARGWERDGAEFWAVVAAPWVLVQDVRERRTPRVDN